MSYALILWGYPCLTSSNAIYSAFSFSSIEFETEELAMIARDQIEKRINGYNIYNVHGVIVKTREDRKSL